MGGGGKWREGRVGEDWRRWRGRAGRGLTREMIASWLARCVLQCLQPKILSEFR